MWRSDAFLRRGLDRCRCCCCGGHLALRRPLSCPPLAAPAVPSSSLSRASVQVCVQRRSSLLTSSYIGLPYILLPHLSRSRTFELVYRGHTAASVRSLRRMTRRGDATRRNATRHAARPRTMLDRIILGLEFSLLRSFYNGH